MKITITITEPSNNKSFDIQVNNKQRIKTTLRVLGESISDLQSVLNCKNVREKNSGRVVCGQLTYEEAGIYSGTELLIISE